MSMHRTKATFIGLLEIGTVNEWVVTEKLGDALKAESGAKVSKKPITGIGKRLILFNNHTTIYQVVRTIDMIANNVLILV